MKEGAYMSNINYIRNILNLKDKNIIFKENYYKEEIINGITHKIFEGYLSYKPKYCPKCGILFDERFEKHGFITSDIKIPKVSGFKSILRLHKQRYLCKHCYKAFTLTSDITDFGCFISNNTKYSIAIDLTKKRSEKDIAIDNNVSHNTIEQVMDSYYNLDKAFKNYLPNVLLFDEFKSVKSADGHMSFHLCDGLTGQTIDIVEDRKLLSLIRYFGRYSHNAIKRVKYIVIDMYSPYISLIKNIFPNALIIIDTFHIIQLISRALNKTRIMIMKKDKVNYNKLKRYWRLLLKSRDELNYEKWKKYACFNKFITKSDVVNYIINTNIELKNTYDVYQNLLSSIKNKNYNLFIHILDNHSDNISSYMKTSIKTLNEFKDKIKNTFNNNYHNGYIEGNNNFIKVIKRIAFGFRSFIRFKTRILICKNLLKINKKRTTDPPLFA